MCILEQTVQRAVACSGSGELAVLKKGEVKMQPPLWRFHRGTAADQIRGIL